MLDSVATHRKFVRPLLQSPYVYLQAAGSDGSDGTAEGIHLRWALQGRLGDNHLPKGDLAEPGSPYASSLHFNRADDYARIYKTQFDRKLAQIRIEVDQPDAVVEAGPERVWRYDATNTSGGQTTVVLRFADLMQYDFVRQTLAPSPDASTFLDRYDGLLELEAVDEHMLRACVQFDLLSRDEEAFQPGDVRAEGLAPRDRTVPGELHVTCRKELHVDTPGRELCFQCEDLRRVRFRCSNCVPKVIELHTYEDYIVAVAGSANHQWIPVGDFALSVDDAEVEERLTNSGSGVDGEWPKFNEADPSSGRFAVRTDNYMDRWNEPAFGLKAAVGRYLSLSRFDSRAHDVFTDPSTQPNEAAIEASYLDLLNMVAADYHVARMLGLGTIDNDPDTRHMPVLYLVAYVTSAPLEAHAADETIRHLYMTPPVDWKTYRLPPAPEARPVRYGLEQEPIAGDVRRLTDEDGYVPFEAARFVNIERSLFEFEDGLKLFWQGDSSFCLCEATIPTAFGVEYRRKGEPAWRAPEISHDADFADGDGVPETVPIPDQGEESVFVHREREEGVHEYALYSINWFSRVSPRSNVVETDRTTFPILKSLKPPSNFAVQLVQEENPRIFTTAAEQAMLDGLEGPDRTLVRVTFDWNHVHNQAYQFADRAQLFFRDELPGRIQGEVTAVSSAGGRRTRVETGAYTLASNGETRRPHIDPSEQHRYVGGRLVCDNVAYAIEDVGFPSSSGDNPTFIVRQVRSTASRPGAEEDEFITTESWSGPPAGETFTAIENVSETGGWEVQLDREVFLEPFHEAHKLEVQGSARNDRTYTLRSALFASGQTRVEVRESLQDDAAPLGEVVFPRRARIIGAGSDFRVDEDVSALLSNGDTVDVYGAPEHAGSYTVTSVVSSGGETVIGVSPAPSSSAVSGYLRFERRVAVAGVDVSNGYLFLSGDRTAELEPPRIETETLRNGEEVERIIGGLTGTASISEFEDVDVHGDPLPGSHTGVFEIVFDLLGLPDHVDPSVNWYKGIVRVQEDPSFFGAGDRDPEMKALNIWEIDRSGATLRVVAQDASFDGSVSSSPDPDTDYIPIAQGSGVEVNVHPGYRIYLFQEPGFDEDAILPDVGEGTRKTLMGIRSIDSSESGAVSTFAPPAVLLAQEIREPVPPGEPSGPTFATRPDFYGKSTYTFDVEVDEPYALVFYRGNDRAILDQLYKPATVRQIRGHLEALPEHDAAFEVDRWQDLANSVTDSDGRFKSYVPGGYRFPDPDNDTFVVPNVGTSPFDGVTPPGDMLDAVKAAVSAAFVPLTERPIIYGHLASGTTTSGRPPTMRGSSGKVLTHGDTDYDPWPMAVRHGSKVRFTDYGLDGASTSRFFYFGVEMSNRMTVSDRSPVTGPIFLVNSAPPSAPVIRGVRVQTANPAMGRPTAVVFEVDAYPEAVGIERIDVYRTRVASKAGSVRSMDWVASVDAGSNEAHQVVDDFSDVDVPPFGETLHYRLVALRRFTNEQGESEFAPSHPSVVRRVELVDDTVPPAPDLSYTHGTPTAGPPLELPDVALEWERTAWNPRYHVYRMNGRGNWTKIHSFATNDVSVTLDLSATDLGTATLAKQNAGKRTIFHRFKVVTENSSGILSTEERPLVI
jgi:hypothetical protein